MANTRDLIGDQATVDRLVSRTITELEEDGIDVLRGYALSSCKSLETVVMPNLIEAGSYAFSNCIAIQHITSNCFPLLKTINSYAFNVCTNLVDAVFPSATGLKSNAFNGCTKLEMIDLSGSNKVTLSSNVFSNCSNLKHLIIRSTTMSTCSSSSLSGTAIANGEGAVYVPTDLISTYKANTYWKNYIIASISSYPITDFSTISDSWADIIANEENGTYLTKYSLGDTKQFNIDGVPYYAQIVGFDKDELTGGGTAKITWILENAYASHNMNPGSTTEGGYAASSMRTHIINDILPNIDILSYIKEVNKTSRLSDATDQTSVEKLWIPSCREMFASDSFRESSGCTYSDFFTNDNSRIKYSASGGATGWWMRSAYNATYFRTVDYGGRVQYTSPYSNAGVVLGFCT